jgi:hypothetical protein
MLRIFDIRLQKLFAVVLLLKVAASGLAWALRQPWTLGFALPIALMLTYIVLGLNRRGDDVTDEKFADSCYYLGFVFTITSIIFALFDLPEVGTRIGDIAVRFGAAMTSTVLGLGVRVYLVSFERDARDALREAEDAVVETAHRLRDQLGVALERLRDFEADVDVAAKTSVERVNLQVESLARQQGDRLAAHFETLAARNQAAFDAALAAMASAHERLAGSLDGVAGGVRASLDGVDTVVRDFMEALQRRLEASVFPPEYFAKYLASPLAQLRAASEDIASHVKQASSAVADSSTALTAASRKLRVRANTAESAFDTLAALVKQQERTLDGAQRHIEVLTRVADSLQGLDSIGERLDGVVAQLETLNRELAAGAAPGAAEGVKGLQ